MSVNHDHIASTLCAVSAAESVYGEYHGEVGLVLIRLAAFYRLNGRYADAEQVEKRIAEIESVYKEDQE
jgi:hypothetical protein